MKQTHKEKWDEVKEYIDRMDHVDLYMGRYSSFCIQNELKHFMISMSRYKFVAKLLKYKKSLEILEIGCAEGLGGLMLAQETMLKRYVGIDMDEESIEWAKNNIEKDMIPIEFVAGDLFDEKFLANDLFDAVFALDVIEHIETSEEERFMQRFWCKLKQSGCCIIGTPNETMKDYASEGSKIAHINLYTHERLYGLMDKYFDNVFMFSMNDEVVSTGFEPMACYIFAVGVGKRSKEKQLRK